VFMPYGLVPGCRALWAKIATRRKPAAAKPIEIKAPADSSSGGCS
jgi:hypothetical protein